MLKKKDTGKDLGGMYIEESDQKFPLRDRSIEGYFISLLFKINLESAKDIIKRLDKEDFLNENIASIFQEMSDYLEDRKTDINIKSLLNKFDGDVKDLLSELYMWDSGGAVEEETSEDSLKKQLNETADRIKKDSIRRQLQNLSSEIKIAETRKEDRELEKLTKKFEKLSKSLL